MANVPWPLFFLCAHWVQTYPNMAQKNDETLESRHYFYNKLILL